MSTSDFSTLVADQRASFISGVTRSVDWRVAQLNAIKTICTAAGAIRRNHGNT